MLQFLSYAVIVAIMMFIWTFVFLNRSNDKTNQAFLYFLSIILLWMVLSIGNLYRDRSALGTIVKLVYFICMFNMSVAFLLFTYRVIRRKLDAMFYAIVGINTLNIVARFLFPVDFSDPTFWRLTDPVIAPIMASIFSLPALVGLVLLLQQYGTTKDARLKAQVRNVFYGILFACVLSVLSEYVLPTWFHIDTYLVLMYCAILVFVLFAFSAIMKHKFLNMRSEYVYRNLFLNASDGIALINKNQKIISINNVAKQILHNVDMDSGDRITDTIKEYSFETNYKQHEVTIRSGGRESYLSLTQYPIDATDHDSAKLMIITDITTIKRNQMREKDELIEKTSTDPLTGLYNKQFFMENYYNNAECIDCALLFIDVDDFKSVNDLYGHIAGDRVLKALADCIVNCIRRSEKAIRFGGDEFVVLLEDTSVEQAYAVAERIRSSVRELNFTQCDGDLRITLSIGLIVCTTSMKDCLAKADTAMYNSKSKGKNRTTVFSDKDSELSVKLTQSDF